MLRRVALPDGLSGRLYLSAMPGTFDPVTQVQLSFSEAMREIDAEGIRQVICLAPLSEVRDHSPEYARALDMGLVPWVEGYLPMPDGRVPKDPGAFVHLARAMAAALQAGERAAIHCRAGVGRTGTLAIAVLVALGVDLEQAMVNVDQAGSRPETEEQREFVRRVALELRPVPRGNGRIVTAATRS